MFPSLHLPPETAPARIHPAGERIPSETVDPGRAVWAPKVADATPPEPPATTGTTVNRVVSRLTVP